MSLRDSSECESSVGGKNSPVHYIPEQDPMQDTLKKSKKAMYFKLTVPNMGNELKVGSGCPGLPSSFYCMCIP